MSREDHCARCGYLSEYHDVARRCPGMKTGKWTERDPIDGALWPEIMARDVAARGRAIEAARRPYIPVMTPESIIVARPPRGPEEFAHGGKGQARLLGLLAADRGMDVAPYYWKSGTGDEGCAVKGYCPTLAFVATWSRKAAFAGLLKGWLTDVAYAWNPSDKRSFPVRITATQLEPIIRGG